MLVLGGEDDVLGGFDPFAVVVDAGIGADGADDGVGGGCAALRVLDDEFEGVAEFAGTAGEEAGGVGVAVDGIDGEGELESEVFGAVPVEEVIVDVVALGVGADAAFAGMALGRGWDGFAAWVGEARGARLDGGCGRRGLVNGFFVRGLGRRWRDGRADGGSGGSGGGGSGSGFIALNFGVFRGGRDIGGFLRGLGLFLRIGGENERFDAESFAQQSWVHVLRALNDGPGSFRCFGRCAPPWRGARHVKARKGSMSGRGCKSVEIRYQYRRNRRAKVGSRIHRK